MLMRKLGRTGLNVAALCLGGNTFGWTTDQQASEAVAQWQEVYDATYSQGGGPSSDARRSAYADLPERSPPLTNVNMEGS